MLRPLRYGLFGRSFPLTVVASHGLLVCDGPEPNRPFPRIRKAAAPGTVPFLTSIVDGKKAILESSAAAARKIEAPLKTTPSGTLIIPGSYKPPEARLGISDELEEPGTATYDFRVAQPGFYEITCLGRGKDSEPHWFSYTIDNWNGHGHSIDAGSGGAWKWVSVSHALALGAGEHTLRLKFYRPGIELKKVRVAPVNPSGRPK